MVNLLKVVYYLILAFPRFFGNALSFIPHIGFLIKFAPEVFDLIKVFEERAKKKKEKEIKEEINRATILLNSPDIKERLNGAKKLESTLGRFTYNVDD